MPAQSHDFDDGRRAACPASLDLAAWVDGRAAEAERSEIERHLTECPICLTAVAAAAQVLDEAERSPAVLPPALAERVRAVVVAEAATPALGTPDRGWWRSASPAVRWLTRSAAAAAAVAVCVVGYEAGRAAPPATSEVALARAVSFGLLDDETIDDTGLALLIVSEGGAP